MKSKKLTKAEEQVMHIIWDLERCLVSDIIKEIGKPEIPHSTISSIVRILEKKGFVSHKAYGRTYEYYPVVTKKEYSRGSIMLLVNNYFGGSSKRLVSFLVEENDLDLDDIKALIQELKDE